MDSAGQILAGRFDELLMGQFQADAPGGTALVVKEGKVIYRKAFGKAHLELDVDMKPDYIFRIGSITKQFTACAIMKLLEEGKLSLQDDINKHITDYPTHGHTITIEHLLTHTSGIKSYTDLGDFEAQMRKDRTPEELIDYFKNEPLDFAPGEQYKYNNSAYALLGFIIEIVSGCTYEQYIDSVFFQALDMGNSHYGNTSRIIRNRAAGYQKNGESYENADFLSMTLPFSAGGLLSNVDDLYLWYDAVMNDKVISRSSREKAHTTYVLKNGKPTGYGYGWVLGNIQGSPMISHGGGINGYLTASLYLPEEAVFVAVFSNCDGNQPGKLAIKMAAMTIGKPYRWKAIELDGEIMNSYVGVYENAYEGQLIVILEEGKLFLVKDGRSRNQLHPYQEDKCFIKDSFTTLEFERNRQGKVTSLTERGTGLPVTWMTIRK